MSAIRNVAIVGAGGHIGGVFARSLIQAGKHKVTALSRYDSKSQLPIGANVVKVNYDDVKSIAEALNGQHFLVITLAAAAPEETHAKIVRAAAEAGVPEREVTFFDDGNRVITISTWEQCGLALVRLLSLPEADTSPSLADYKNANVLIGSFNVSQRNILDSLHRVLGTTDDDWTIKYESSEQRIKEGAEEMREGSQRGVIKWLCANTFLPSNIASDFTGKNVANGVLHLPEEDLDVATKRVVTKVESGWSPFEELNKGNS
ncbi:hypothetical protein FSST1_009944 [Fusarium sambucinum]